MAESDFGIPPNACLADIVVHDALRSGKSNEGMFFAARTFLQKIGTTLGIMTFASLTNFGNSPAVPFESDLGVRLSGPAHASSPSSPSRFTTRTPSCERRAICSTRATTQQKH